MKKKLLCIILLIVSLICLPNTVFASSQPSIKDLNNENFLVPSETKLLDSYSKNPELQRIDKKDFMSSIESQVKEGYVKKFPEYINRENEISITIEEDPYVQFDQSIEPAWWSKVNAKQDPYRSTFQLTIMYFNPNGDTHVYIGSGFYVGGPYVGSAGHCVYDKSQENRWADQIAAYVGLNDLNDYLYLANPKSFSTLQSWIDKADPFTDISRIEFAFNWSDYGINARQMNTETILNSFQPTLFGYSATSGFTGYQQYENTCEVANWISSEVSPYQGMYTSQYMGAQGGQSGGPLNYNGKVVGLLHGGNTTTDYYVTLYPAYAAFLLNN